VLGLGLLFGLRLGQFDDGPAQLGRIHPLAADTVDANVIPFTHMTRTTLLYLLIQLLQPVRRGVGFA
jgi:hypothetical protein